MNKSSISKYLYKNSYSAAKMFVISSVLLLAVLETEVHSFSNFNFLLNGVNGNSVSVNARGESSTLKMGVTLTELPYSYEALAPFLNKQTLEIHHGKHHKKYVTTTNDMIKGTDLEGDDVVSILKKSFGTNQGLFNNAAQSYNHDFYWKCMKPGGGGKPTGKLAAAIDKDFGSYDNFRKEFVTKALTAFGSGWGWLVATPSGLKVTNTIGANTPLTDEGSIPLLTVDVWEHAYYLDYQNMRNTYVDTFLDNLVDWDAVAARLP